MGVQKGGRVGVMLGNSMEYAVVCFYFESDNMGLPALTGCFR